MFTGLGSIAKHQGELVNEAKLLKSSSPQEWSKEVPKIATPTGSRKRK